MENNKMITDNSSSSWHLQMIAMEEEQQQHHNQIHFTDHHYHQNPLFNIPPNYPLQDLQTTPTPPSDDEGEDDGEELGPVKEMMYKMAAMQPVDIDPNAIRKPKRRNVRISDDPQSVAARRRRERISERIRILQRLVPGGAKMDTASMLDEAIRYVKFLKRQIRVLNKPANSFSDRESDYSFLLAPSVSSSSSEPSLPFDHYKLLASSDYCVHGQRKSASPAAGGFFGF